MQIDRSMPLPSQLNKKYEEFLAKLVLENFYPDRYIDLELSDKPDLRNETMGIGIEVTSSVEQVDREVVRLWSEAVRLPDGREKDKKIKGLKKLGINYTGNVQIGKSKHYDSFSVESGPFGKLLSAVESKLDKINQGHYAEMKEYDLFIHSDICMFPEEIEIKMPWLLRCMEQIHVRQYGFTYIYALCPSMLCIWDLKKRQYDVKMLNYDFGKLVFDAKEKVIEREEVQDE